MNIIKNTLIIILLTGISFSAETHSFADFKNKNIYIGKNIMYIKKEFVKYSKTHENANFKEFLEYLYNNSNNSDIQERITYIYNKLYKTSVPTTDDEENETIGISLGNDGVRTYSDGSIAISCNAYHTSNDTYEYKGDIGDGLYRIDPIGTGESPFVAYCDMDNGGWTLIGMLYENSKFDWNNITNGELYHTDLDTKVSYILPSIFIPDHEYVGFGKDYNAIYSDGLKMHYSEGDFLYSNVESISGAVYSAYRDSNGYYDGLDYEDGKELLTNKQDFKNCLSIDIKDVHSYSWTFCPNHRYESYRGHNLNGNRALSKDNFAWTLWVK